MEYDHMKNWKWWVVLPVSSVIFTVLFTLKITGELLVFIGKSIDIGNNRAPKVIDRMLKWVNSQNK